VQCAGSMTSDIAGATDYQNDHEKFPTERRRQGQSFYTRRE
jgi:hypothetical protein